MYSLMSIWMSASRSPNMYSASDWARKVLPTPVGPRKMNEPIGRRGSFKSARERRSAFEIAARRSFSKSLRLGRASLVEADRLDIFLDVLHVRRPRHRTDARARAGFVHHVDRLVGQKTSGEIAIAEDHALLERFVGVARF